ncbi:MAG: hypothetical protein ACFFDT_13685 [Candidatus Hodarchaeota archaeon]
MPEPGDEKKASRDDFVDSYTRTMERRIRALETERQLLEVQRNKLESERDQLKQEVMELKNRLRELEPPLHTFRGVRFDTKGIQIKKAGIIPIQRYPVFTHNLPDSFFTTEYSWVLGLKGVTRDDKSVVPDQFFLLLGEKKGAHQAVDITIFLLFEFKEPDLMLRGVGPTNLLETTEINRSDLLNLAFELIYRPEAWHNKTVVAAKPKNEWKLLIGISKTKRLNSD